MITDPDLELDPDVRFAMAQQGDFTYPCTSEVNDKRCRKMCTSSLCPGSGLSERKCVADPQRLTEVRDGLRSLSKHCIILIKPYKENGSEEHPRVLLYRFMHESSEENSQVAVA